MYFATSCILLFFAKIGAGVYIHIEDGLCIDLYDPLNMKGGIPDVVAMPVCGDSIESACGTTGDSSSEGYNPYDCTDCHTVTIYEFKYSKSDATASPSCQGVFTFPSDFGDVYYKSDGILYDAFGDQLGDACSGGPQGKFLNPWNSVGNGKTQPAVTPCPSSSATPPAPSATCYYNANPEACPCQYEVGWCFCNDEDVLYPIQAGSNDPCGWTVLPTTTTTSPICTATVC